MSGSRILQTVMQMMPSAVRGFSKAGNVAGRSNMTDAGLKTENLHIGIVVQSHAGAYDAQVRIGRKNPIPCVQLSGLNGYTSAFGQTESSLLQEGTPVLVYRPGAFSDFGIIIAPLPAFYGGKSDKEKSIASMLDPEPSAASFTELSYRFPMQDNAYTGLISANAGRAVDIFPGDKASFSEFGVGMALLQLAVVLRSSARAKLEMFCLDDLVRMVSGQYQHFSGMGEEHIYNDYGYVTHERFGSMHQCEVNGMPKFDDPISVKGKADLKTGKECDWKAKESGMIPHRRFHSFMGHMGGLYQFFLVAPDDGKAPNTYGAANDKGLAHIALDDGGRIMVRSVSDIRLERVDMIALPRKNKEPWDPEGEKLEDGYEPEKKLPFKWGDDRKHKPGSHPLQERDYFAWARRLTYLRFWELSDLNDKKDWILKEEAEAPRPVDKYDVVLENEEAYTKWEDRSSSFALRQDGGITMRNSSGAEISLCGPDIVLACPGDIQLRAGKQIVALAQDDLVLKARNSVDISATAKDVRIKAQNNLQQYSGKHMLFEVGEVKPDDKTIMGQAGGKSSSEAADFPKGIVMRAKDQRIVMWAKELQLSFTTRMIIEGAKAAASKLYIAVKDFLSISKRAILAAHGDSGTPAGIIAQGSTCAVFGEGAHLIGKSGANVIRNGEVGVFMDWVPVNSDPYQQISDQTGSLKATLLDTDDWLGMFSSENRELVGFAFRTDADYDTESRELYEAHWAFSARKRAKAPEPWKETKLRNTSPWPGAGYCENPGFLRELDEEVNVDAATGKPKPFGDRKKEGGQFNPKKFNEYRG